MHFSSLSVAALAFLLSYVRAQQVGTSTPETHPKINVQQCTKAGGCTTVNSPIVLDSNWRWLHSTTGTTNCYDGNTWDATLCPDNLKCVQNCAIEGADYAANYGITTSGSSLTIKFVTVHQYGTNVGGRVYLMENDTKYRMLKLLNKEFTFDVDVSLLPCGLNGALYLVEMASDGGMSTQPNNKAGAKYGTGYCDAQCPHDIKLIGGEANVEGWSSSPNDPNAGKGKFGTCCAEMDIWEANSMGSAFTPHPCSKDGPYKCSGIDCGDGSAGQRYQGVCDKDGCDFNAYRMGATSFYGPGKTVNTNMPMTVVTQFITQGNSDTGALIEIRRLYVQGGKIIYNAKSTLPGLSGGPYDSVTTAMCTATKTLFGDNNHFQTIGGMAKMGAAMNRGMVLVMSIWDDYDARMLWLDSSYPLDKDPSLPGIKRGDCATTSGEPKEVEANGANISVKFSNIKWGEIGSTYTGTAPSTTSRPPGSTSRPPTSSSRPPSPSSSPTNCRPRYQQCGGQTYTGAKCCQSGSTCTFVNTWYSQCI